MARSRPRRPQLEAQAKLDLPLWLVESLAKREHVDIELPKFYGVTYRQALRADAAHLNLASQSDFYFDVGVQLSQLLEDEADLGVQLLTGFASRFHGLLGASLNATGKSDSTSLKEKLTLRERDLFERGREAAKDYERWRSEKPRIEQSVLVGHTQHGGGAQAAGSAPKRRKR